MRLYFVGIILTVYVRLMSAIVTYPGTSMCRKNIYLSIQEPAVEIDYYNDGDDGDSVSDVYPCITTIIMPSTYYGAIKLRTIDGSCSSYLNVYHSSIEINYRFCGISRHSEIGISPDTKITLEIENKKQYALNDRYNMMVYIYRYQGGYQCNSSSVRCTNGRCLDRELFCYEYFNFCDDSTNRNCLDSNGKTTDLSFGIIGIIALILALCLVCILVVYFCCYYSVKRNRESHANGSQNRRTRPTARDVYSIPTSQNNADGIDYVIDYQKFLEPPPYHSLEMETMSSVTAHVQSIDSSGTTRETEMDRTLATRSLSANTGSGDEIVLSTIQANSGADNGARNYAFESTENELPSYTDVISDEGRFNVDRYICGT